MADLWGYNGSLVCTEQKASDDDKLDASISEAGVCYSASRYSFRTVKGAAHGKGRSPLRQSRRLDPLHLQLRNRHMSWACKWGHV